MEGLDETIAKLRSDQGVERDQGSLLRLRSTLLAPADDLEIGAAWGRMPLPLDLLEVWRRCRGARLFEDIDYGQWGLVILTPAESADRTHEEVKSRAADYRPDDVVVGEFLGDLELLVLSPSEAGARRVLVALPLYRRDVWFGAAASLSQFLLSYWESQGSKYWEE